MNTRIRTALAGAIIGAAAPVMLFLGAASAQAAPDVNDRPSQVGFDPQPEPPGSIRGFDPQPDPPRIKTSVKLAH